MLVTIIYNTEYASEAGSLKNDILEEWSDCKINKMGIKGAINNATYQIQLDGNIIYTARSVGDNTTIINSIKERL
jgi:hypothetical protein